MRASILAFPINFRPQSLLIKTIVESWVTKDEGRVDWERTNQISEIVLSVPELIKCLGHWGPCVNDPWEKGLLCPNGGSPPISPPAPPKALL